MNPPGEGQVPLVVNQDQPQSLFHIANALLKGSMAWRVLSWVYSVLTLSAVIAFIAILDGSTQLRFIWAVIYIFMAFSGVWLSVQTRDQQKRSIYEKYGQSIPELKNQVSVIGNARIRLISAWVGLVLSLGAYITGLILSHFSGPMIFNCIVVGLMTYLTTFQQAKVAHDRADHYFLRTLIVRPVNVV